MEIFNLKREFLIDKIFETYPELAINVVGKSISVFRRSGYSKPIFVFGRLKNSDSYITFYDWFAFHDTDQIWCEELKKVKDDCEYLKEFLEINQDFVRDDLTEKIAKYRMHEETFGYVSIHRGE